MSCLWTVKNTGRKIKDILLAVIMIRSSDKSLSNIANKAVLDIPLTRIEDELEKIRKQDQTENIGK